MSHGGSLLAAAELESSKLYILGKENEWTILHSLPVGEEVILSNIKLKEQLHENESPTMVEFLPSHSRLWKADIGINFNLIHIFFTCLYFNLNFILN